MTDQDAPLRQGEAAHTLQKAQWPGRAWAPVQVTLHCFVLYTSQCRGLPWLAGWPPPQASLPLTLTSMATDQ